VSIAVVGSASERLIAVRNAIEMDKYNTVPTTEVYFQCLTSFMLHGVTVSDAYGGGSADWAKAVAGIKYSYLIELRDTGIHGFQLPVEEIIPTGKESWAGVREISFFVLEHHHPRRTSYNRSASAKQVPPRICANAQIASYVYSDGNISHGSTWQTSLAISLSTTIVLWQFGW